jgi:hypothetical protein
MTSPPRFLLGAALLFWGAMTERVVPGIACALLVEGAHWTRVRWNFGERAFLNAWRLSVLFLLVTMVLVLLNGARLTAMSIVFTWLPVVLLPLQFVQAYGMTSTTTLATFSMMVRRRREHAQKFGLPFREIRFGFGNVFLCATLLASCLGSRAETPVFYPILVLLGAWGLMAASGRAWKQVGVAFTASVLMSALLGTGGEMGLMKLYRYMSKLGSSSDSSSGLDYARERRTSIGSMGPLKQSPEIVWRLIPEQGPLPRLLRIASYNTYLEQGWQADLLPAELELPPESDGFTGVADITNPDNPDDPEDQFYIAPPNLPEPKVAVARDLPRFRLRGATSARNFSLLPLPGNAASLHQFDAEEFERNPFGTFRIKPSQPVADARVLWHPDFSPEMPPWKSLASAFDRRRFNFPPVTPDAMKRVMVEPEFQIPPSEAAVMARVVTELGLREVPLEEKITRLRRHFVKNFRYTRYNRTREDFDPAKHGTLLGKFLTDTRAGHCEFFATATALLLREAGVPTRYVTGFMAAEIDPKTQQALLRGTHAHAWCRAWDAGLNRWIDVDLTPPDWLGLEAPRMARFQGLTDWFQRLREDLLVWRDKPGHMMWLTLGLLTPIVIGIAYIGRNLWRSRSRLEADKARLRGAVVVVTPLTALEKPARKLLGERPPGTPLAPWLMKLSSRLPRPELLTEALALHHRLRFDPAAPAAELTAELRSLVDGLRRDLGGRQA